MQRVADDSEKLVKVVKLFHGVVVILEIEKIVILDFDLVANMFATAARSASHHLVPENIENY